MCPVCGGVGEVAAYNVARLEVRVLLGSVVCCPACQGGVPILVGSTPAQILHLRKVI